MSNTKLSGKGVYVMSKDEMRTEIFHLRREVQFQKDCKDCAEDQLQKAKEQGFFDGYHFSCYNESWIKKNW